MNFPADSIECLFLYLELILFLLLRQLLFSTLFPYTTLFRSRAVRAAAGDHRAGAAPPRAVRARRLAAAHRSEEHTSELQSRRDLVCRLLLEKKNIPSALRLFAISRKSVMALLTLSFASVSRP